MSGSFAADIVADSLKLGFDSLIELYQMVKEQLRNIEAEAQAKYEELVQAAARLHHARADMELAQAEGDTERYYALMHEVNRLPDVIKALEAEYGELTNRLLAANDKLFYVEQNYTVSDSDPAVVDGEVVHEDDEDDLIDGGFDALEPGELLLLEDHTGPDDLDGRSW